jgi:hypothetical protein
MITEASLWLCSFPFSPLLARAGLSEGEEVNWGDGRVDASDSEAEMIPVHSGMLVSGMAGVIAGSVTSATAVKKA